jgi:predicted AAA+ superfamily ATPase
MIERINFLNLIRDHLRVHPACGLLGPRQCGKTTLANAFAAEYRGEVHRFDLEDPRDLLSLSNPMIVLEQLKGLVIIDEIQKLPDLFPILRVLIDRNQASYLILGSASRDLIKQSSETLAGRIGYIELTPFCISEGCDANKLMMRGGFPRSFLANSDKDSYLWRESYIQTFLERDIPNLGFSIEPMLLRRFWMMMTSVHGQMLNIDNLSKSLSIPNRTVRHYIDILSGTFMMRHMQPWFENISKRQVKTPKMFFRDSGILLALLGIDTENALMRNQHLGSVWEGFALEQVIQFFNKRPEEVFYWRTQDGAELDLLIFVQGQRLGFEFKFSDIPKTTKSMHIALSDLRLDHLFIISPRGVYRPMQERISMLGLEELHKTSELLLE